MADTAVTAPSTPKKKATKPKKPATHPKYCEMIKDAVKTLKERGGSSRQAILKYILKNYQVGLDEKTVNNHLKLALRAGVKNASLKQSKGTGAAGSFKIGEQVKEAKKPVKAKPKKAKSPTKAVAKKAVATKTKKPKSPPKKAAPKKAKSPKKSPVKKPKAAKPKAKKPTPKKAAPKKPAKK